MMTTFGPYGATTHKIGRKLNLTKDYKVNMIEGIN